MLFSSCVSQRTRQARSDTEAASSISSVRGRISIEDAEGVLSYYRRSAQRTPTACDLQSVRSRVSFCCRMHVPWELRICAILRRPFVLDTGGGVDDMRPRINESCQRWVDLHPAFETVIKFQTSSCVRFVTRTFRTSTTMGWMGYDGGWRGRGLKSDAMRVRQ